MRFKKVGITSQQEIENAVREAIASGRLKGDESLSVRVRLEFEPRAQPLEIDGHIDLR